MTRGPALFQRPPMTTRGATTCRQDSGFAVLLTVIAAAVVMAIVATTLAETALSNVITSAHDVQQEQALQAAQAGIDATYQRIQSLPSVSTSPCGTGAVQGSLGSSPTLSSYSVSATYYETTTARSAISCTQLHDRVVPQAVELTSRGTDAGRTQVMVSEADVAVSPFGSLFGDAVYVASTLTLTGNDTFGVTGKMVYVKGNTRCGNGGNITGNLVTLGNLTLTGDCRISGSAEAGGVVTIPSGSPFVGTTLTSTTATKSTDVTIYRKSNPTLHAIYGRTSISYSKSWATAHPSATFHEDDTALSPPPQQTMPTYTWTNQKGFLQSSGFNLVTTSTCQAVYDDIFAMKTSTSKVAIHTTCLIKLPGGTGPHGNGHACPTGSGYCTHVYVNDTLYIFSTKGFTLPTPAQFTTTTSSVGLALVVPTDNASGAAMSCTSNGDITFTGKIYTNVDTLFYTPCTLSMTGSAHVAEGEVYAGHYIAKDGMSYGKALLSTGSGGSTPSPAGPASVGIIYEREAPT